MNDWDSNMFFNNTLFARHDWQLWKLKRIVKFENTAYNLKLYFNMCF